MGPARHPSAGVVHAASYVRPVHVRVPRDDAAGTAAVLAALQPEHVVDCRLLLDPAHVWTHVYRALCGAWPAAGASCGLWDVARDAPAAKAAPQVALLHAEELLGRAPDVLAEVLQLRALANVHLRIVLLTYWPPGAFVNVLDGQVLHVLSLPGEAADVREQALSRALERWPSDRAQPESLLAALCAVHDAVREHVPGPDAFADFCALRVFPLWLASAKADPSAVSLFADASDEVRALCTGAHAEGATFASLVAALGRVEAFLLLAGHIAARNAPATDARLFEGGGARRRGRPVGSGSSSAECSKREGGAAVSADRVVAIFFYIYDGPRVPEMPRVEAALGRLVALRLFARAGTRLRVLYGPDTAQCASRALSFDVSRFLAAER